MGLDLRELLYSSTQIVKYMTTQQTIEQPELQLQALSK